MRSMAAWTGDGADSVDRGEANVSGKRHTKTQRHEDTKDCLGWSCAESGTELGRAPAKPRSSLCLRVCVSLCVVFRKRSRLPGLRFISVPVLIAACATSANPAMKKRADDLAQTRPHHPHEVPAPSRFDPRPWAPGQWILLRATVHGETVVQRLSVVEKEARGLWVETDTQDYRHRNVTKVLYPAQPRTQAEALDIAQSLVVSTDGQPPKTFDLSNPNSADAAEAKEARRGQIQEVIQATDDQETGRENVTVVAGTFMRCVAYVGLFGDGALAKPVRGWAHPDVPLMGLVKAASDDGDVKVELLDYGETGGTSALAPQPAPASAPAPTTPPPPAAKAAPAPQPAAKPPPPASPTPPPAPPKK